MAKKRKYKNLSIMHMKKKILQEISIKTKEKLIDELIVETATETLEKHTLEDFTPKNPNENIFCSIMSLQMLVNGANCDNCGQPRLEIEVPERGKNIMQRIIFRKYGKR